jgi:GGDEF domain-containing protein
MSVSDSNRARSKAKGGSFLERLAFPPFLLAPVLIIAVLARDDRESIPISMPAVFAMFISYGVMSILFVSLRKSGKKKEANSVSLISCGVLLLFLSLAMGLGEVFGWLGTILIVFGLALAMSQIVAPEKKRFALLESNLLPESVSPPEIKKLLDAMAFPSAFLKKDENGNDLVIAINETLASMIGKNNHQVKGLSFSSVLPNSDNALSFKFAGSEWVPNYTSRGNQILFMLSPMVKKAKEEFTGPTDAIDRETGLFTPLFLKYRANADVEACRRYNRKLAVVLFRLSFVNMTIKPSEEAEKNAFVEFGKMAAGTLRACDSGYRLREDEVMIFLPDTPQNGAKIVVSRIFAGAKKLSKVECVPLASAKIEEVTINYFGDEVSSVDQVMNDVYVAMGRSGDMDPQGSPKL